MLYVILKTLHIVAVIAWMAGMFYLPRLYVYHTENWSNKELGAVFCVMERRLLRVIINPALIVTLLTGIWMVSEGMGATWQDGWLHAKLTLVAAMLLTHGFYARWRRHLANGQNAHSSTFYRVMNEVPTILLIGIVYLVVAKPF